MNELIQKGMAALKSGDRPTARKLLASAVQQDPRDVTAWLWLAAALDKDEERMTCLQQVLKLDPGNQAAARGLAQILEHRTRGAAENVQKTAPAGSLAAAASTIPAAAPAAPAPQVRPTPPPATSPAAAAPTSKPASPPVSAPAPAPTPQAKPTPPSTVRIYETPQPPRPAVEERTIPTPIRLEPPVRNEPQPAPTPTAPPAPKPLPTQEAPNEPAESFLRAEFAAYQPEPEVEAPPEEPELAQDLDRFDQILGTQPPPEFEPSVRGEPEVWVEPEALTQPAALNRPAAVSQPAAPAAAPAAPAQVPARRRKATSPDVLPTRVIFRTRPSMVPALLCFWLFFFGSVMIGNLLGQIPLMAANFTLTKGYTFPVNTLFAMGMGLLLELVVLYTALRIFTVRYELTNHYLWVYFRGKRARVPLEHIYEAECRQSLIQKIIGTGHLELDLSVHGELAHVRLRDIPDCKKRMDQIMYLVQEAA